LFFYIFVFKGEKGGKKNPQKSLFFKKR